MTDPIQPPSADQSNQPPSEPDAAASPPTTPIQQPGYGAVVPEVYGQSYGQPQNYGQFQDYPPGYSQPNYGQQAYSQPGYGYAQPDYSQAPPVYSTGYQVPPPGYAQPGQPPYGYPGYFDPYAKSRLAAGLLGIFLGGFGVHRFYLGYPGIGVAQILVSVFTGGLGAWWGIIEGIMILARAQSFLTDATGRPLRD
jgi:TM2 domain-containing membrane protein YozV